jgi:Glucose / Sorbosone dehydrogenase
MARRSAIVIGAAAIGLLTAGAFPASAPAAVTTVQIGSFDNPTYVADAPGFPRLLFVVERGGRIEVMRDEVALSTPYLDISSLVLAAGEPGAGTEQGLFSIAFPPDYAESRRFYVAFTNASGDIEVDEFQRSATNPARADPSSRRRVIAIPHPFAQNHNGGQLQFAPSGNLLFLSTGDGGAGQSANAPDLTSLLGKLLRINPRATISRPYGIPSGNPFVGRAGRDEIFAYGLRNPWRFSFDSYRIAIGDVGHASWEEVDLLRIADARGANFGWPEYEGNELFAPSLPGQDPVTFPIHTYSHADGRCSITGGFVVRDPELSELTGRYLYGDFCTGELRSLWPSLSTGQARGDAPVGVVAPQLSSFGEGVGGQIYLARISGPVYRLEPAPAPSPILLGD